MGISIDLGSGKFNQNFEEDFPSDIRNKMYQFKNQPLVLKKMLVRIGCCLSLFIQNTDLIQEIIDKYDAYYEFFYTNISGSINFKMPEIICAEN